MGGFANSYWADCHDLCYGWEFSADYLYWQPKRGNLFYATTASPTPTGGTSASGDPGSDIKGLSVDPEWKSAYRLDLMKTWTCYCFDTEARFTRFINTSKDDASVPSGGVMWGMRLGPASQPANFTDSITNVSGEYNLNYNVLDLLGGYSFSIDRCNLLFRPYGGAKLMWIKERFRSITLSDSSFSSISVSENEQKSDLGLYGPTLGFENRIFFCCDSFSLNLRAGGALLWTDVHRTRSQIINNSLETIRMTASSCMVVPAWEIQFGLASGRWCIGCFTFNCEIGYDFQGLLIPDLLYFDDGIQLTTGNPAITVVFPAQDSNVYLALHGLHARISVNF